MSTVHVRVIAADGVTQRIDFNDRAGGFAVVSVQEPEENVRDERAVATSVDGSYRLFEAYDDGFLLLVVRVSGSSWAQCMTRWQLARTAYRAESHFYIETEADGVTTRYRTERPDVVPGASDSASLVLMRQTYQLRFRVQPNPTITFA